MFRPMSIDYLQTDDPCRRFGTARCVCATSINSPRCCCCADPRSDSGRVRITRGVALLNIRRTSLVEKREGVHYRVLQRCGNGKFSPAQRDLDEASRLIDARKSVAFCSWASVRILRAWKSSLLPKN